MIKVMKAVLLMLFKQYFFVLSSYSGQKIQMLEWSIYVIYDIN